MAQARRTKKARAKASPKRGSGQEMKKLATAVRQGLGIFLTGAISGIIVIIFWQGYNSAENDDMGSGIRAIVNNSRIQAKEQTAEVVIPEPVLVDKAPRIKPQYDFYTVLPEIEEVLPRDAQEVPPPVEPAKTASAPPRAKPKPVQSAAKSRGGSALPPGTTYMLQVASYGQMVDAERLKAKLALSGLRASIQQVSIERKKYYRVRIGPYSDYGTMTSDDYKLSRLGFKAMRLRLSKAG